MVMTASDTMQSKARRAPSEMTAADLMTGHILRARADWSIDELTCFLGENGISGAPVVAQDGRLVGVVSLTDVARTGAERQRSVSHEFYSHGPSFVSLHREEIQARSRTQTVADIMTPLIFDVPTTATPSEIAETMIRGRIHRVFVTENDMVVGIISAFDLMRLLV